MASLGGQQILPTGKAQQSAKVPELGRFVSLLPELYYAVNRVLEDCTPHFSKRVGVALWALSLSDKSDNVGKFLTTSDLSKTFRDWFVVSEASASSQVSKTKTDLFDLGYVKTEGGNDHIHLTEKGQQALDEMIRMATGVVEKCVGVLNAEEQRFLLDFARRMIATKKPPASESMPLGFPNP